MAWTFNLHTANSYDSSLEAKIAGNSEVIDVSEAVTLTGGFIVKTDTGDTIEWVSATVETFDSDNQTVAQKKVVYRPVRDWDRYRMTISAAVTQDDVGKFYDLVTVTQVVDVSTESATTGQVKLEEVESDTHAIFSIANA